MNYEWFQHRADVRRQLSEADDLIVAACKDVNMNPNELFDSPHGGTVSSTEYMTVSTVQFAELLRAWIAKS